MRRSPDSNRADDCGAPVTVMDDFISANDCRRMLAETARGKWFKSQVQAQRSRVGSLDRTSESLMLPSYSAWAKTCLRRIECRLAAFLRVDPSRLEPWQITRYRRGEYYDYHLDCGAWARHPSGERVRTVMIVLQAPVRGGATHFRALARSVRPVAGRLIAWENLLDTGGCNHAIIHAGRPVWQGCKTILTTWEHERPYVDP